MTKNFLKDYVDQVQKNLVSYEDERGIFCTANLEKSIDSSIVQLNTSFSKKNVFRGLHYQKKNPQGKYLLLVSGKISDYSIQLDHKKPDFGVLYSVELRPGGCVYIPPKYAHGLFAHEDSLLIYLCTTHYDKESDSGILVKPEDHFIMSDRDRSHPPFDKNTIYFES